MNAILRAIRALSSLRGQSRPKPYPDPFESAKMGRVRERGSSVVLGVVPRDVVGGALKSVDPKTGL